MKKAAIALAAGGARSCGGWTRSSSGWGSKIGSFTRARKESDSHATIQAVWLPYQLKYRYAGGIEENYPE